MLCSEVCFDKPYPCVRRTSRSQDSLGIGAHRDFGVITLLLQGDVPGLEVWDDEAKDWYPAPPVEGAYVVNMGNLFEQWTNDKYISNVHRVINRSGEERFSIPFNYNGNPDFVIKCIEKCRTSPEEEKYAPVSVEDYVVQKYKDVYARAGVYKTETFAGQKVAAN
jgi:isopenicillin N synthase-like dioxygenase